ncbi:transposase [Nonomuraea sp. NPDC052265]|uniref:transposase n=1 Tax=Nonomuraea sp. NPDC052265 TaxID=3364374 RepID=UPI0037C94C95
MTRRRRQFSPEFKDEAVRMVLEGDRTVASVAREFGINASTLGSWVNRHRIVNAQDEQPGPVAGPDRARIRELERENAELREKLIFLRKAALDSDDQRGGKQRLAMLGQEREHAPRRNQLPAGLPHIRPDQFPAPLALHIDESDPSPTARPEPNIFSGVLV